MARGTPSTPEVTHNHWAEEPTAIHGRGSSTRGMASAIRPADSSLVPPGRLRMRPMSLIKS